MSTQKLQTCWSCIYRQSKVADEGQLYAHRICELTGQDWGFQKLTTLCDMHMSAVLEMYVQQAQQKAFRLLRI